MNVHATRAPITGRPLFLRQIAGTIARRVVFAPNPGDTVQRGAVVGMIRFGSRIELWLPIRDGYVATVWRGDRVRGGVSVVARVHPRRRLYTTMRSVDDVLWVASSPRGRGQHRTA
jgi:phosphatidylserine decarboxylase